MPCMIIDVGSSSVRALLMDEKGAARPGKLTRRQYAFETDPDGRATIDAVYLLGQVEACIDDLLAQNANTHITAVGLTTFAGNLLGVDAQGEALTPIYTYADARAAADVESLRDQINPAQMHQQTGCIHHTAYHPGKLHWLHRTQPQTFHKVRQWLDFATYCYRYWFGRAIPCSYAMASWSGLLNRERLTWHQPWLDVLKIPIDALPELADYNTTQSGLTATYAARWPALADVPFYLAVGDGVAANIGSGGVSADNLVLTIGTTGAVRIITPTLATVPDGLWAYRVDADYYLVGGATTEGGNIYQWLRKTLNLSAADLIEAELAARTPGQHGLNFSPLLAGERSPGWHTNATGGIQGLRLSTTPMDIVHAALESIALRLAHIARQLPTHWVGVYAGGGALQASPAWVQLITDALGKPIQLIDFDEVTARGMALLINGHWHEAPPPSVQRQYMPNMAHHQQMQKLMPPIK